MISESTYTFNRIIIYSVVFIFEIFGIFGNINLIILTYRKKSLQTKSGLLLMILAIFHCICLGFEYVSMGFGIASSFYNYPIHRRLCFYTMLPHIFSHCLQTGIILQLSFDLFLAICIPSKHFMFNTRIYLPIIFIPAILYGIVTLILGVYYLDDQIIPMCNPPSALVESISNFWYIIMFIFSFLTLVFYISTFGILYYKSRMKVSIPRLELKAMKTLKVIILIFLFARLLSIFLVNVIVHFGFSDDIVTLAKNYNVICAMVVFSQNAYVCYFRSTEYRALFNEQFGIKLKRADKFCFTTVHVTTNNNI